MKQSNKSGAGIIQALSLVLLMIPVLYAVTGTGIISNIGYEDVYWERARYLLGQGGATLYDGSSLCSLGYSFVLVPICAVFKSPYAAYKRVQGSYRISDMKMFIGNVQDICLDREVLPYMMAVPYVR